MKASPVTNMLINEPLSPHSNTQESDLTNLAGDYTALEFLRSPLAELVNIIGYMHMKTTTSHKNLIYNMLRHLCTTLDIQMPNFTLGKYLFERTTEVEELEKQILKNPENILKSSLFLNLVEKHINVKEVGVLRQRIKNDIQ